MKRFHPVIHVSDLPQALKQIQIARDNGADGVWMIGHSIEETELWDYTQKVRREHPGFWMGINFLGLSAREVFTQLPMLCTDNRSIDGVWVDDAGIWNPSDQEMVADNWKAWKSSGWPGEYFGGVAFKYGHHVREPERCAHIAAQYMDVVTTSGEATGEAADVKKIRDMKKGVGDRPLAIASGITPENVGEYLPYVDVFLVATGISNDFHSFNAARVRQLADKIREDV